MPSGGGTLASTFSPGLVDHGMFVSDVAGGDDNPRKKGPGRPGPVAREESRASSVPASITPANSVIMVASAASCPKSASVAFASATWITSWPACIVSRAVLSQQQFDKVPVTISAPIPFAFNQSGGPEVPGVKVLQRALSTTKSSGATATRATAAEPRPPG